LASAAAIAASSSRMPEIFSEFSVAAVVHVASSSLFLFSYTAARGIGTAISVFGSETWLIRDSDIGFKTTYHPASLILPPRIFHSPEETSMISEKRKTRRRKMCKNKCKKSRRPGVQGHRQA
jgi:hypothetical protein